MNTSSFSVRTKLFIGFFAIIFVLFISVVVGLFIISATAKNADRVIKTELPIYDNLVDLSNEVFKTFSSVQSWVITHDEQYRSIFTSTSQDIQKTKEKIDELFKDTTNTQLIERWSDVKPTLSNLNEMELQVFNARDKATQTNLVIAKLNPMINKIMDTLITVGNDPGVPQVGLLDIQLSHLTVGSQKILKDMFNLTLFEYAILVIGLIAGMMITLITAKKILPPLKNAIGIAKKIAAGERNMDIKVTSNDEMGELLTALHTMQDAIKEGEEKLLKSEATTREMFEKIVKSANQFSKHSSKVASGDLREHLDLKEDNNVMNQLGGDLNVMTKSLAAIVKEIIKSCHNMVSSLEEVRHAVDTQSAGASEQASSINQITASLSEIEKSSVQTIEKAKVLGESAERTRERGQQGVMAVDQSIDGMKAVRDKVQVIAQTILDLSNQTQQVGEITAVVNNLAQQSKMLALNASIEAAKAGEAGKGFAVVAVEVKNLAEQSEQATTQVQKILENIRHAAEKAVMVTEEGTKGVDEGTGLVEEAGDIIRNLNNVIHETTIAGQQIESAVRQESAGIEQIATGMNEINQVTSSFVESVKQTTEAISNLSEIAISLKSYIDTYKI